MALSFWAPQYFGAKYFQAFRAAPLIVVNVDTHDPGPRKKHKPRPVAKTLREQLLEIFDPPPAAPAAQAQPAEPQAIARQSTAAPVLAKLASYERDLAAIEQALAEQDDDEEVSLLLAVHASDLRTAADLVGIVGLVAQLGKHAV